MKRMTKMEKVEKIHELNGNIESAEGTANEIFERKLKKPFSIVIKDSYRSSNRAWGIQPHDFSEEAQIRLQKYYGKLVRSEIKSMKDERDRLLRLLK